jgi:hypothetical protein
MPRPCFPSSGVILIVVCLLTPQAASAIGVTNGDFSSGFDGWLGEVTDIGFNTVTGISPLPGGYANSFVLDNGQAVLTTSTLTDGIFAVYVYQPFAVDTAAPGESLLLSFDLTPVLTDPGAGDAFFAWLVYGPDPLDFIDLVGQAATDITFLSGQSVEIAFGVEDFDDLVDTLTIDNVAISRQAPVPTTLALMLAGLLGLHRLKARAPWCLMPIRSRAFRNTVRHPAKIEQLV